MKAFSTPAGVYNATPPAIVFGAGAFARLPEQVECLGARRPIVVTTPGRGGSLGAQAQKMLGAGCAGLLPRAISQVPIELLHETRSIVRDSGADCIVAVGGGAATGLAKGLSLELALPIINVPTTYSGSEMTGFCGITIDGVKRMHTSLNMLARTVIYDPELSRALPLDISAASAFNALAHCVDALVVDTCSPIMALAATEGARVLHAALSGLGNAPDDMQVRTDLLYGAYLGGAALTGGFALQHGLAHVLGGSFGVSHGLAHALVLPHVTHLFARKVPARMAPIAAAWGVHVEQLGETLFDSLGHLGLPTSLKALGFAQENLASAVTIAIDTDNSQTPFAVSAKDIERLFIDVYEGNRPHQERPHD
jgi:maleylacetate reductase